MRRIEVLTPTEHADARGSILTFLPPEAIVEYNLITYRAGSVRGLHWHPHFIEYMVFATGRGVLSSQDKDGGPVTLTDIYPGLSVRAVSGVAHAVRAITDMTAVAMLTRRWAESDPPLIRFEL